jgi:hypothetical protein
MPLRFQSHKKADELLVLRGLVCCRPIPRQSRRVAAGGARRQLMLWRSALRSDCTPVLGPRSRRKTHYAHFVRCVQTTAASQMWKRAVRADLRPPLLIATQIATTGHRLPRSHRLSFLDDSKSRFSEGAFGQAGARLWSAEKRRARGRARSAHQLLTRRVCLSRESAANGASSATWPRDRASQGSRSEAKTAPAKRGSLPGRAFAAPARHAACDRHESIAGPVRSNAIRYEP